MSDLKVVNFAENLSSHALAVRKFPPVVQRWASLPNVICKAASWMCGAWHLAEDLHGAAVDEVCLYEQLLKIVCHAGCFPPDSLNEAPLQAAALMVQEPKCSLNCMPWLQI